MTTPAKGEPVDGVPTPMTPERWRAVDAILQSALACEPARRHAVVADACNGNESLRREVASLLAAHDDAGADFLERPAAKAIGAPNTPPFAAAPLAPTAPPPFDRFPNLAAFAAALPASIAPLGAPPGSAEPAAAEPAAAAVVTLTYDTPRGRTVSGRAALYAAAAALVLGLVGGVFIGSSSLVQRWTGGAPASATEPVIAGDATLATVGDASLSVVDRAGRPVHTIPATRPWTPRFSPDGNRVAYGAFGAGRHTSDLWVTDLNAGATRRLTDGEADSNDPQWSADGTSVAYSMNAPEGKDLVLRSLAEQRARVLARRSGNQFPSDWLRDGSALLVTEMRGPGRNDILVQPADGSAARPYAATPADETAARISPDGRWIAYTSDESGRAEVYLDSYPRPGRRVTISSGSGAHPVWRGDGRELFYWRDGVLVSVPLTAAVGGAPPVPGVQSALFRAPYSVGVSTMYDVSPDGMRFVIAQSPR